MAFENDGKSERTSRRSLLKTVGGGALVALGFGAGRVAAANTTEDCWYEYQCLEVICPEESDDGGSTEERRQCCEDPDTGEVTCGDWEYSGCCSLY